MSDGDIYVNYGSVSDVEDVLAACTNAVSRILDEINSAVGPLIASWQGSSQDAYSQVQAKRNADNNLALQWSSII